MEQAVYVAIFVGDDSRKLAIELSGPGTLSISGGGGRKK